MQCYWRGKRAVITGGSAGLGRVIADDAGRARCARGDRRPAAGMHSMRPLKN